MAEKQEDNIDLINLILMLNQNALISLGEASRFAGGKKAENLPHARQTINMIKAIQEKTKNNLTPGEMKLLFRLLGDLQAKYVKAAGLDKLGEVKSSNPKKDKLDAALDKFKTDDLAKILADISKKDAGNK
jgi:hypothetical protein